MKVREKYKYAYALTSIASAGLSFIEVSLSRMMKNTTDQAYLRSFYILLSYNFELILKSRVVMVGGFSDKKSMNNKLIKLGHDIAKIGESIATNLQELGIKEISSEGSQFKIITIDGEENYIENFVKIRYDFLEDVTRSIDDKEHARMKKCVEMLHSILKKTKEKNIEQNTL